MDFSDYFSHADLNNIKDSLDTGMVFNIKGKVITVIGAARSGIAVANTVIALGGKAQISEFKRRESVEAQLGELVDPLAVAVECGGHTKAFIERSDYVVLSPGVRGDIPPVQWALDRGIEVMGEIEFAYRLCPCPIVAVTGSNGKTTTVTLIADMLKAAGKKVCLCGNIGHPFSKYIPYLTAQDIVVLEISSFQLESTIHFKPHVSVWTNFAQNHLDRHKDLEEYFEAKCALLANQDAQDVAVLNFKQAEHHQLAKEVKAKVLWFNGPDDPIGIDNPNYLAAMKAVAALGVGESVCRDVFRRFKGVEHRLEFVRTLDGVDYINDSKSTTVEAGRWALERAQKPMVMICGGSDKKLVYDSLKGLVAQKVKHIIAIGEIRDIIKNTFSGVVPVELAVSLEDAVNKARVAARAGDVVTLSPMTASFDMFNDYEHRGRVFKEIVEALV